MLEFLLTYKNLLLHILLSLSLSLLLTFIKIPIFFLYGLQTYIHPDNLGNGAGAAIRRPESSDSGTGLTSSLKKRNKNKEKFEFDEKNAQIFMLTLDDAHIQSRIYSNQYCSAFTLSFIAISSILLHNYLGYESARSGSLANGVFVPVILGFVAAFRLLILLSKVSFERSASRRSEKQLSFLFGILGLILGFMICFAFTPDFLDFKFDSIDGSGKFFIAVLMGCLAGFLFMPATKNARSFWLGTDQVRSNLDMITCGWLGRGILYANYLLILFSTVLWINPISAMLINKNINDGKGSQNAEILVGQVGFLSSDFAKIRFWCLLLSGILQLAALRPNLQMYLNEALLSWYQRLHTSKVPDLDYSRAKVFLHNHYLCLVVLQFLVPPVLLLLFLGLSQVDGNSLGNYRRVCNLLPCSSFVKEVAIFMAWWIVLIWSIYTSATVFMFRRGLLYLS